LKEKDKISDKFREQVDELLDNQSDNKLFNPLNEEELDEIWEEISAEIDISEVWNGISSDLDIVMPVNSVSGIFAKSIAAVLIILIGMIPVKKAIMDSHIDQPGIIVENRQNAQPAELIINNKPVDSNISEQTKEDRSAAIKSSLYKTKDVNNSNPEEINRTGLIQDKAIPSGGEVVFRVLSLSEAVDSDLIIYTDRILNEKSNILPVLIPGDNLRNLKVFPKTDLDNLKINYNSSAAGYSLPSTGNGRISAGFITLFKNTWLLNNKTLDGLKSESLNSSEIVFFPDVGLSLNYALNKTWQIQADGFLFSNTGQKYLEYLYGHYVKEKITLKYSTIALSVKHKFTGSGRLIPRSSVNVLAGGYFSVLKNANHKINTDTEDIRSQYAKFDFGIRLAGEIELQISNQLSIAPGLFVSLGMPNIYKGNDKIPGYLIRTHNGSAEFHLTFYYHFN
jgi:hypothetical protein